MSYQTDRDAYFIFLKMDRQDPERFARAVANPANEYPQWLQTAAVAFLANPQEWHTKYFTITSPQELVN
jgi:hypothetical protein